MKRLILPVLAALVLAGVFGGSFAEAGGRVLTGVRSGSSSGAANTYQAIAPTGNSQATATAIDASSWGSSPGTHYIRLTGGAADSSQGARLPTGRPAGDVVIIHRSDTNCTTCSTQIWPPTGAATFSGLAQHAKASVVLTVDENAIFTSQGSDVWSYGQTFVQNSSSQIVLPPIQTGTINAQGALTSTSGASYQLRTVSITAGNLAISSGNQAYIGIPSTIAPTGTTGNVNWNNGNYQIIDLSSASGNVTLTYSNPQAGASYLMEVRQSTGTIRTLTLPTGKWANGITYTATATTGATDLVSCAYNGAYLCSYTSDHR
jgi:hypothetical protein